MQQINHLLGQYQNGNYIVKIYSDGTKIRETSDSEFIPEFAESCDIKITNYCNGNCPFCYESSSLTGNHADLNQPFIDTLHPFTEVALNGNDLSHPHLVEFLTKLKSKDVIANLTVSQKHFMLKYGFLKKLSKKGLIHGLGISMSEANDDFIGMAVNFPNSVIHTIAGITPYEDFEKLFNRNAKVLILGYKNKGRGVDFLDSHEEAIKNNIIDLRINLKTLLENIQVLSFDNLALEQLQIKSRVSDEVWNSYYMGDDGQFTFYIDMVNKKFAKDSLSPVQFDLTDNIDEMFRVIRK